MDSIPWWLCTTPEKKDICSSTYCCSLQPSAAAAFSPFAMSQRCQSVQDLDDIGVNWLPVSCSSSVIAACLLGYTIFWLSAMLREFLWLSFCAQGGVKANIFYCAFSFVWCASPLMIYLPGFKYFEPHSNTAVSRLCGNSVLFFPLSQHVPEFPACGMNWLVLANFRAYCEEWQTSNIP